MSLSKLILKILGWKTVGKIPRELKKYIIIVYPHTSSKDLFFGFLLRSAYGIDIKYIGKAELFKGPFAWFFYWTGGQPVIREKKSNYVASVVSVFKEKKELIVAMSPEGTRKRTERFRTGFYYIAHGAEIPILMVQFNAGKKEVRWSAPFYPTGDIEVDLPKIYDFFRGVQGFVPNRGFL